MKYFKGGLNMATINSLRFPRVTISKYAVPRSTAEFIDNNTTTLFVPFTSAMGPENKVQKIFSLAHFISEYGEADFSKQGRTILNVYNWLSAGGSLYALRLVDSDATLASGTKVFGAGETARTVTVTAKYKGSFYKDISVVLEVATTSPKLVNVAVLYGTGTNQVEVERFSRIDFESIYKITENSKYIGAIEFGGATKVIFEATLLLISAVSSQTDRTVALSTGGVDGTATLSELVEEFYEAPSVGVNLTTGINYKLLLNKLEYPIDLVLDAGYTLDTKNGMVAFATERDDVTVVLDLYDFSNSENPTSTVAPTVGTGVLNVARYAQKLSVSDVIAGRDIWVTPTYFLSQLLPFNDSTYGVQFPTAGLTRGALTGVKEVNENPSSIVKEGYYNDRINYVEKDSRGYRFMSQLVGASTNEETALKFLNNLRSLNKIARELENLGRRYLFEFNDSITLNNMRTILNRYLNDWVQNRTLNLATLNIAKDPLNDERVNVALSIRFTGTIEIISIDIVIQ
jgi:hypothetical protein